MQRPEDMPGEGRRPVYYPPQPPPNYGGGGNKNNSMLMLVIAVVISVIVSMIGVSQVLNPVSKADFSTNIQGMQASIDKATSSVTAMQATVNALPSSLTTQVNNAISQATGSLNNQMTSMQNQVNNMAGVVKDASNSSGQANTSLAGISAKIDALTKADTDANTKITALQTQLTADEATIKTLQQTAVTPVSPNNPAGKKITVVIKSLGNNGLYAADYMHMDGSNWVTGADSPSTSATLDGLAGSIRLTLTNNTNVDITDITLDITFSVFPNIPTAYTPTLSGGGVPWQIEYKDPQNVEFYNGAWGLTVPAQQSTNLSLTLGIQGNQNSAAYGTTAYYFQVQATAQ